jgi:hypothetical protein
MVNSASETNSIKRPYRGSPFLTASMALKFAIQ